MTSEQEHEQQVGLEISLYKMSNAWSLDSKNSVMKLLKDEGGGGDNA